MKNNLICRRIKHIIRKRREKRIAKKKIRVVCDTGIWYVRLSKEIEATNLTLTQISAHELATTKNLNGKKKYEERARLAIQQMMRKSKTQLFLDPFNFMIGKGDPEEPIQVRERIPDLLMFLQLFANGRIIDPAQADNWEVFRMESESGVKRWADTLNKMLESIRPNVGDPSKRKKDTDKNPHIFRMLIASMVSGEIRRPVTVDDIDWKRFELFETVGRNFITDLETTNKTVEPNDFYDLWMLVYVGPGDLYWVHEKYWKELILKCGMRKYLYERPFLFCNK